MSSVTIPITDPTTRTDGSTLPLAQLAEVDVYLSDDNGQTWTDVGHAAAGQTSFVIQDLDPGSYLARATATDTQASPLTSAPSADVNFVVPAPELAAPSPPTLGTPLVSS